MIPEFHLSDISLEEHTLRTVLLEIEGKTILIGKRRGVEPIQ